MTIVVTVLPDTRGQLNNDARVTSDTVDPSNANNFATTSTQVRAVADLKVTKTDSPDPVVAGRPLDYSINILNQGGPSSARDVTLTDDLPQDVTYLSATISNGTGVCDLVQGSANNEVVCELNDLQPDEHVNVILHVMVNSGALGPLTNRADVVSDAADNGPGPSSATANTNVNLVSDLLVVKTSDRDTYKPSDTIEYTITVTNRGPSDARQVVVTDTMPPAAIGYYVFDTQSCAVSGVTATCSLGTIAAGQTKSFNLYFRVQGRKGVIENKAVGNSTGTNASFDPVTSDNTSIKRNDIVGKGQGGGHPR